MRYTVEVHRPESHLFRVRLGLDPDPAGQVFTLPTWIPGSYLIREFARHVVSIEATCHDRPVSIVKIRKDAWRCAPCEGRIEVTCEIYAFDRSVRAAFLDDTRCYFNGTALFLLPQGREQEACEVDIPAPGQACARDWQLATTLPNVERDARGFGRFRVSDYATLIDHPVEMGVLDEAGFRVNGIAHRLVLSGRHDATASRVAADLAQLCVQHHHLFGDPPPFERYLFLTHVTGEGYGGLEHRDSTSLVTSRESLPAVETTAVVTPDKGYRGFLGLASHEYFHAWNVKRIRPQAFAEATLAQEAYTRDLWVYEGITSYYDDLLLARSNLIETKDYLALLGENITRVLRSPGRAHQSLAESSFDAWIKFYRQDENSANTQVNYYAKGAMVALALDLHLRWESGGACTLDDVMRAAWQHHRDLPLGEGGFEQLAARISGLHLDDFFARYVHGTEDPPLAAWFAHFGVDLTLRTQEGAEDKGGHPAADEPGGTGSRVSLGLRLAPGSECRVAQVITDGPAGQTGLSAHDVLVAVDGIRITRARLDRLLKQKAPGTPIRLHAFRDDVLREYDCVLAPAPLDTCVLSLREDADEITCARRNRWLKGN